MNCLAQRIVKKSKQNCAGYFGKYEERQAKKSEALTK